jgi:tRNA G18 (ribose-2'-O)-methylase SpoU
MPRIVRISDRADPRVAPYLNVRENDLVGRRGRFIAEGEVVLRVLLNASAYRPLSLFLADKRLAGLEAEIAPLPDTVPVYVAPQSVMDEVAGFPMHRGILALGERSRVLTIDTALSGLPARATVVVLLGIANHDNMGGLLRNAAAFGVDLVILDSDCCDPLYRKAIRVSAGNALRVPFVRLERGVDVLDLLEAHGFTAVALSPGGGALLAETPSPERLALLFGAEGPGLPEHILRRARAVRIPITADVDSLNVATASGIALHHFVGWRAVPG